MRYDVGIYFFYSFFTKTLSGFYHFFVAITRVRSKLKACRARSPGTSGFTSPPSGCGNKHLLTFSGQSWVKSLENPSASGELLSTHHKPKIFLLLILGLNVEIFWLWVKCFNHLATMQQPRIYGSCNVSRDHNEDRNKISMCVSYPSPPPPSFYYLWSALPFLGSTQIYILHYTN